MLKMNGIIKSCTAALLLQWKDILTNNKIAHELDIKTVPIFLEYLTAD